MKEADKNSKASVGYEHPAKGRDHCEDCVHYHKKQCDLVKGVINPQDWCELYQEK